MKRLVAFFAVLLIEFSAVAGPFAVSSQNSVNLGSLTYASLPTCDTGHKNNVAFASDLGANGADVRCNGTRWRPINGRVVLATLTSGGPYTNSETIALQTKIPAGFLQTGDVLQAWTPVTKSGTTDSANVTFRMGTAGTTADTAITGASAITVLGASGRAGGFIWEFAVEGATSLHKLGLGGSFSYTGGGSTAASAATTISNVSNALWFSVAALSSGATDTVSLQASRIELITP